MLARVSSASFSAAKSLSITASTPFKRFKTLVRVTGMPPPPAAITMTPSLTSSMMAPFSIISIGLGEATTRRQPRPASSLTIQPFSLARALASFSE